MQKVLSHSRIALLENQIVSPPVGRGSPTLGTRGLDEACCCFSTRAYVYRKSRLKLSKRIKLYIYINYTIICTLRYSEILLQSTMQGFEKYVFHVNNTEKRKQYLFPLSCTKMQIFAIFRFFSTFLVSAETTRTVNIYTRTNMVSCCLCFQPGFLSTASPSGFLTAIAFHERSINFYLLYRQTRAREAYVHSPVARFGIRLHTNFFPSNYSVLVRCAFQGKTWYMYIRCVHSRPKVLGHFSVFTIRSNSQLRLVRLD